MRTDKKKKPVIIFIHGYTSSPCKDWYQEISKILMENNMDFIIPKLPGGRKPRVSVWLEIIRKVSAVKGKEIILVGHSLGTRAALLWLEKDKVKVKALFLFAAFANRLDNAGQANGENYHGFFSHKIDLKKVRGLAGKIVVIHSRDDSSIAYSQAVELAGDLQADLVTLEGKDHLSEPSNASLVFRIISKQI